MQPIERPTPAAQMETDHQRWADDGGFIPRRETPRTPAPARSPWRAIGIAAAVGFAIGWMTSTGSRGGQ